MTHTPQEPAPIKKDWRYKAGLATLILAGLLPFAAILIPLLGLPAAKSALIATLLVGGGPEVLCLIAVALMGKENFARIVEWVKTLFHSTFMATPASKSRYYAGLTLSLATLLPLYLYGYLPGIMPGDPFRIYILAAGDFLFIASILIMGGEFWGKFRALFIWEGKV